MKRTKAELEESLEALRQKYDHQHGLLETSAAGEERLAKEVDTLRYQIKNIDAKLKEERKYADNCRKLIRWFARIEKIEPDVEAESSWYASSPSEPKPKDPIGELPFEERTEILLQLLITELSNISAQ